MIYKIFFKKRRRDGKKYAFAGAESVLKTRETIGFVNKSGKTVAMFSVTEVKDWIEFCEGDDPAALGLF
jgi:hypothetical protein